MRTLSLPAHPFTASGLPELGLTPRQLRQAVEEGRARRLLRGVYVAADIEDSVELRTAALALVVGDAHVIVDRTAAWLHGVDTFGLAELRAGPPIECCVLRGSTRTRLDGVRGRTRDLRPDDVERRGDLCVTTPLRTALDLGCHLRRREAFAAICGLARGHAIDAAQLRAGADRFRRRRGVLQLRELIPLLDTRLESAREAWTLLAIRDAGLPAPEPQLWVEVDGVATYRLDLAYPAHRVCVEYDGFEAHEQTEEQRRYDAARRAWLRAHGWKIIVVRLGDFTGTHLDGWLTELRSALASTYTTRRW